MSHSRLRYAFLPLALATQSLLAQGGGGARPGSATADPAPFAVEVRDVRVGSAATRGQAVATVRLISRVQRPVTLVMDYNRLSAVDDRGNAYRGAQPILGIGFFDGGKADTRLTLAPGGWADASFGVEAENRQGTILGTRLTMETQIHEVRELSPGRWQTAGVHTVRLADLADGASLPAAGSSALTADLCAWRPDCSAAEGFVAEVARFNTTLEGSFVARLGVRFRNPGTTPMILCVSYGSMTGADDRGNALLGGRELRAMSVCDMRSLDLSFVIAPGASREAMLTYGLNQQPGTIRGTKADLSFAVQQFEVVPGGQARRLREIPVLFRDLNMLGGSSGVVASSPGGAGASDAPVVSSPSATGTGSASPPADPCAGIQHCYASGPFTAQLTSVVVSRDIHSQHLRTTTRIRNLTGQPLILCFSSGSGVANDDRQNRYRIMEDRGIKGIGLCTGTSADVRFVVAAGGTRDATIEFLTGHQGVVLGEVYALGFELRQIVVHPGNQLEQVGSHVVNFEGVTPMGAAATAQKAKGLFDRVKEAVKKP